MKIAVYAIALNESQFVKRCIESAVDADCFILADTGSTDKTLEIAKECNAVVHQISIQPWRFDHARNAALALVPADIDVCIALDLDEVLEPGWREDIEAKWNANATRMRYQYDWGSGIVFKFDKIHARKGYSWKHPCHEVLMPDPRIVESFVETDRQLITHLPDNSKSRSQYLPLLEVAITESPQDERTALYYARELMFNGKNDDAIPALQYYLNLNGSDYERAYAMRLLASANSDVPAKLYWLRKSCAEYPDIRENWVHLAQACYVSELWTECLCAVEYALTIATRPMTYTSDPLSWGSLPYDLGAVAAWHLENKKKGKEFLLKALELEPKNSRLLANLEMYGE